MDDSYSPTATWREGCYEGATEDGGRVLFFAPSERYFVPSKTNMIARFQVQLNLLITDSTQGDHASTDTFEAEDVGIVGGGGFSILLRTGLFCSDSTAFSVPTGRHGGGASAS
jgi:hypothetical protein